MSISESARAYAAHGWALVEFARGTKGPTHHGWNSPQNVTQNAAEAECFTQNIGLCHAYSGTCCVDLDDIERASEFLGAHGVDIRAFVEAPDAVRIASGRPNRAKLLYALPPGIQPLRSLRPANSGLELRCASSTGLTVQDVLPPSIHPLTQQPYVWEYGDPLTGHWSALPVLPDALLTLWRSLLSAPAPGPAHSPPQGVDADRLRGMLSRLDPDMDYNQWSKVGMALHHEAEGAEWGLDLWDEWSARGSKYKDAADLTPHWRSFGSNRGRSVTIQSLISMAGGVSPEDFDDLSQLPDSPPQRAKFEVVPVNMFATSGQPEWIVKGVIPAAVCGVLFAESGAGKSFAVLDIAASIARGEPWNGQRVRQGKVVYVAAEGAGGLRMRALAYAKRFGVDLKDLPLGIIAGRPNLLKDDHKALGAAINAWGGADLLVIDTLAQSMAGGDENSGEDMGKVLAHCQMLHSLTGAMVLLVHHSGKDAARGARGWSGLKAAMDCELEIIRDGEQREMRITKQKDGEDGLRWGFRLSQVDLGVDSDGDALTSCVVEWGGPVERVRHDRPPEGWQRSIYEWVENNLQLCDGEVPVRLLLDQCMLLVPKDPNGIDRRRDNARRALERLIQTGWLEYRGDNVAIKPVGGALA